MIARTAACDDTGHRAPGMPTAAMAVPVAYERAGTYEVTVELAGNRPSRCIGVRVTSDECHVRTVHVTALLQPLPCARLAPRPTRAPAARRGVAADHGAIVGPGCASAPDRSARR